MSLAPKSIVGRAIALLWFALCLAVLMFGFVQRGIHDMPIAFVWFLILLSFPIGAVFVVALGVAIGSIGTATGMQYLPFWHELPLWLVAVLVGYWQWFVLAPRLLRSIFRGRQRDDGA